MHKIIAAAAAALACTACVSVGTNYNTKAANDLQVGEPMKDVIKAVGKPNAQATDADGNTVLVWVHSTGSIMGASARSLKLTFDKTGKLIAVPAQPVTP